MPESSMEATAGVPAVIVKITNKPHHASTMRVGDAMLQDLSTRNEWKTCAKRYTWSYSQVVAIFGLDKHAEPV